MNDLMMSDYTEFQNFSANDSYNDLLNNCTLLFVNGTWSGNLTSEEESSICGAHFDSGGLSWLEIIVQILYGLVCVIGICGNTLVIYVVVRFSKMQTVTNVS